MEAGIIEAFHFDPFTGLAGVAYTPHWIRILQSRLVLLVDPFFSAALLADDPVAMRMFVEREGTRLATEEAPAEGPRGRSKRGPIEGP
jgi:hypothetical protein